MSEPVNTPSFLSRVCELLPQLHPAEKRLADFILDFPGELASYSALELAKLADVSTATVSRFIRRLGYTSFEEARRHVRTEKQQGSPLFLADRKAETFNDMLTEHAAQVQENMRRTYTRLSESTLDEIVKAMLSARKVWFTGMRSNQFFAQYFQWQFFQLKENSTFFPSSGSLAEYLSAIGPKDMVVVFGVRRRPTSTYKLLEQLVLLKVPVLYISDANQSLMPDLRWHIQCPCDAAGPFDNHVAIMALCNLLLNGLAEQAGSAGRQRMALTDALHESLHEF